jgi:hypothetical protein
MSHLLNQIFQVISSPLLLVYKGAKCDYNFMDKWNGFEADIQNLNTDYTNISLDFHNTIKKATNG